MSAKNVALPGTLVIKSAVALPATTTSTLFTQSGGSVMVNGLVGLVTTTTGGTATTLAIGTTGANNSIGTATTINGKAAGSWILLSSTSGVGGALTIISAGAAFLPLDSYTLSPFLLGSGQNITLTTSATDTGNITWYCWYVPIDTAATLS